MHPYSSILKNPGIAAESLFSEYKKKRTRNLLQALSTDLQINSDDARSLISSVSGTIEDGEISETEAPVSETTQNYYTLYEPIGTYINRNADINSHSGIYVKTVYNFQS